MQGLYPIRSFTAAVLILFPATVALAADPFKLGVEEKGFIQDRLPGQASYPAPVMIMPAPASKTYQGAVQGHAPFKGSTRQVGPRPAIPGRAQVVLPSGFLGLWNVAGQRSKVEGASPEYQQQAEQAFQFNTSNIWEISGNTGGGYMMGSNTGIKTAIIVDKVEGSTAFIRYQHPIGNTMAQEAIVMTLVPGGAEFNALERVTIIKANEPPRCRVTYRLVGSRQR